LAFLLVLLSPVLARADWPRFRGPNGNPIESAAVPDTWSADENIRWKVDLPGPGSSSPCIAGDLVFVTCYTGYGTSRTDPGQPANLTRHLLCFDRRTGALRWERAVKARRTDDPYRGMIQEHGYASSTPATDGKRVFVFYGKTGLFAYDLEGNELWSADLGDGSAVMGWGSAASPIVHEGVVIMNASAESEALVALNAENGQEVWRAQAGGLAGTWCTPVVVEAEVDGNKRQEVVLGVPGEVWGLNFKTGKLAWYATGVDENVLCTSLVAGPGTVYLVGGRAGTAVAVRLGGKGDVSQTHVLWTARVGSYVPSPLLHEGRLYWVSDRGIACCINAENGEVAYRERLPGNPAFYASVVLAGDKLYAVSRLNGTYVLEARPEFKLVAQNVISDDSSDFSATPAVADGCLYLRSQRRLYCVGKP
jgi:outer membrane protein assembly factor BamB